MNFIFERDTIIFLKVVLIRILKVVLIFSVMILYFSWCGLLQSSQLPKLTQGEMEGDDKKDVSYESSQAARVAQSLQAHDYVSFSLHILPTQSGLIRKDVIQGGWLLEPLFPLIYEV